MTKLSSPQQVINLQPDLHLMSINVPFHKTEQKHHHRKMKMKVESYA